MPSLLSQPTLVLGTRESANHVFHDLRCVIEMYRRVFLLNHCLVSSRFLHLNATSMASPPLFPSTVNMVSYSMSL